MGFLLTSGRIVILPHTKNAESRYVPPSINAASVLKRYAHLRAEDPVALLS